MEDGEERSEAQESESHFRQLSSFRLFHELYLKPAPSTSHKFVFLIVTLCNKVYIVWLVSEEYMVDGKSVPVSFAMQD